jgi:hypothetical protein
MYITFEANWIVGPASAGETTAAPAATAAALDVRFETD